MRTWTSRGPDTRDMESSGLSSTTDPLLLLATHTTLAPAPPNDPHSNTTQPLNHTHRHSHIQRRLASRLERSFSQNLQKCFFQGTGPASRDGYMRPHDLSLYHCFFVPRGLSALRHQRHEHIHRAHTRSLCMLASSQPSPAQPSLKPRGQRTGRPRPHCCTTKGLQQRGEAGRGQVAENTWEWERERRRRSRVQMQQRGERRVQ